MGEEEKNTKNKSIIIYKLFKSYLQSITISIAIYNVILD